MRALRRCIAIKRRAKRYCRHKLRGNHWVMAIKIIL
jgi:hypothetical protein